MSTSPPESNVQLQLLSFGEDTVDPLAKVTDRVQVNVTATDSEQRAVTQNVVLVLIKPRRQTSTALIFP